MHLNIYLPVKPISVNSMYFYNKRHGLTQASKEWYQTVFEAIRRQKEDFERLRNHFEPAKHVYRIYIEIMAPVTVFYTKKGELTNKIADITNCEKSIVDALMLKKFFDDAPNLCTDDRYLQYMESKKVPTERYWGINVKIEIVDKPSPETV